MRNSKMKLILLLVALTPSITWGQSALKTNTKATPSWKKQIEPRMVSQLFTAYELGENKVQKVQLVLKPELRIKFHKNLRFTGIARLYSEMMDHLEPGRPLQEGLSAASKRLLIGDRVEMELREFYVDWYVGKRSTLRLGKQQIVWGETDGLKLLDVLNPQNFREFMLEDFEDSRIPTWAVKAEFNINKFDVEMVWIPDMSYHDLPSLDGSFFPTALIPQPPGKMSVQMLRPDKPDRVITDSDFGIKLSAFIHGWDLTLNYLYHYDDMPVLVRELKSATNGKQAITLQPQYKRIHTVGSAFNNAIGPITLRGEFAYHIDRPFMTASVDDADGMVGSDQFMFAIGADWLFNETMLSIQSFHDILTSDVNAYNRGRYEANLSFLASQELLNDELMIELLLVHNLHQGDGMIRPKASYYVRSNLKLMLGSDIFYGTSRGLFGQFQDRTRLFVGMEWGI